MPDETIATPKPKRTRKSTKPRAAKTLDPGIVAINERRNLEVAAYRSAQASAKILKTFLEKRLPRLTAEDRQKLFDELSLTETPSLLPEIGNSTRSTAETGMAG